MDEKQHTIVGRLAAAEATIARARRFVGALRSTAKLGNRIICIETAAEQLEAALDGPKVVR